MTWSLSWWGMCRWVIWRGLMVVVAVVVWAGMLEVVVMLEVEASG